MIRNEAEVVFRVLHSAVCEDKAFFSYIISILRRAFQCCLIRKQKNVKMFVNNQIASERLTQTVIKSGLNIKMLFEKYQVQEKTTPGAMHFRCIVFLVRILGGRVTNGSDKRRKVRMRQGIEQHEKGNELLFQHIQGLNSAVPAKSPYS